jgi:heptosyltransferase II
MKKKNKVLIIKTGYSETLDKQISQKSSLGDVLRTTVILHLFKEDHVTWLVDEHAFPLLYNNPQIDRILLYNLNSVLQLQSERFDTVINFEKVPGLCAFSDSISAWRRFGFRFDEIQGIAQSYDNAEEVLSISKNFEKKKNHTKIWQEALFEMLGKNWNNEKYILGYEPKSKVEYKIGLNWAVGSSYPTKEWPKDLWEQLGSKLDGTFKYTWQEGLNDIYQYIDWINSCELLVTSDSLGQHIALALNKKLLVLFGPTHPLEVYLYGLGKAITPKKAFDCMPCMEPVCGNDIFCMDTITPEQVLKEIQEIL